jgi:hypothetical protein
MRFTSIDLRHAQHQASLLWSTSWGAHNTKPHSSDLVSEDDLRVSSTWKIQRGNRDNSVIRKFSEVSSVLQV